MTRWVCLDVGECLVDETRVWSTWADVLGVPRFTLMATLGGCVARGEDHERVFDRLGRSDWRALESEKEAAFGGFRSGDLYPDALPTLARLRQGGYRLAVIANQPAARHGQLAALGVNADVMAMSGRLGVAKPDPAFFARALELMASPDPADVAYVGDRVDNDVRPAAAAGMRAVRIRRGPWGLLQDDTDGVAALVVGSLDELAARMPEAFTP